MKTNVSFSFSMCFGMKPIIETRLTSLICLRIYSTFVLVGFSTINQGCTNCGILASWLRENGERMIKRKGNGERMRKWREIYSLHFLIFSLFPPSLSISYIKNCLILSQNVKYGTFVMNVTKKLTYALWESNSGSNSLWESSASCEGLHSPMCQFIHLVKICHKVSKF